MGDHFDLYPTPTRVRFLADVADGRVHHYPATGTVPARDRLELPGQKPRLVTATVQETRREGWIKPPRGGNPETDIFDWQLDAAGERILAQRGTQS